MAGKTVQQGACILIIEDDPNMQQQLSQWLTTRNYKLITAENQKQGREALEKNDVDLVLMDVQLPDGDDMYYCTELKGIRDVQIIIISGAHVDNNAEVAGFDALADDFIRKPPRSPQIVLARIEAALRKSTKKLPHSTITSGRFVLDRKRSVLKTDINQWKLTPIESKLVEILMINADSIVTYGKLQEYLYDLDSDSGKEAIQTNMSRFRHKMMDGFNGLFPIESIKGMGYQWNSVKAQ